MIKPTIGRVVWFWREGADLLGQPEAASVAFVHSDALVNLQVIDHKGNARAERNVSLRQPNDPPWETTPFAEWMPFQVGQAAKTEQAEKAAAAAAVDPVEARKEAAPAAEPSADNNAEPNGQAAAS